MKTRLQGFYWVKYKSFWLIAEWYENEAWYLCGIPKAYNDNDFEQIGELVIRDESNLAVASNK